jgi:hypothetical protein
MMKIFSEKKGENMEWALVYFFIGLAISLLSYMLRGRKMREYSPPQKVVGIIMVTTLWPLMLVAGFLKGFLKGWST